jgi:hypothetical protein
VAKILLLYVLPLALFLYAIIDCAADEDVDRTSLPKAVWIIVIILFPYLGALAWLAVAKIAKPKVRRAAGPPGGALPRRLPRRTGPIAPDDNPDFLRRLAEDQARRERERQRGERRDGEEPGSGPNSKKL